MIHCRELNKDFDSKSEMFKALLSSKDNIIKLKKAAILKSSEKGHLAGVLNTNTIKGLDVEEGYFYAVINTTKYIDSHLDVHLDSIWTKSLKENKNNLLYVSDHSLKIADVIAWSEDVEAFTQSIEWKSLGKDFEGETTALIYKIKKDSIQNIEAKDAIESKRPIQNSVRMQYVKIELAVNSTDKEYQLEKKAWNNNIDLVANKDVAEEVGYMWLVEEAKIIKEGSMVLFGSNDATPIIYESEESKSQSTSKDLAAQKSNILLNLM